MTKEEKIEKLKNDTILKKIKELWDGKGDTWWSVKYFMDHNVYIKIWGSYSSYNGTEFYMTERKTKPSLVVWM